MVNNSVNYVRTKNINTRNMSSPKNACVGGGGFVRKRFLPFFLTPSPTISRTVFDSRSSFFAPKLQGNAFYAG